MTDPIGPNVNGGPPQQLRPPEPGGPGLPDTAARVGPRTTYPFGAAESWPSGTLRVRVLRGSDHVDVDQGGAVHAFALIDDLANYILSADPMPVTIVPTPVTPRALDLSVIAVGGTAVVAVAGPVRGGFITNPPNAASQGITTAENLYIDMVAAPGSTDATAHGSTVLIAPGQTFTLPTLPAGVSVWINAAHNGHAVSGEVW